MNVGQLTNNIHFIGLFKVTPFLYLLYAANRVSKSVGFFLGLKSAVSVAQEDINLSLQYQHFFSSYSKEFGSFLRTVSSVNTEKYTIFVLLDICLFCLEVFIFFKIFVAQSFLYIYLIPLALFLAFLNKFFCKKQLKKDGLDFVPTDNVGILSGYSRVGYIEHRQYYNTRSPLVNEVGLYFYKKSILKKGCDIVSKINKDGGISPQFALLELIKLHESSKSEIDFFKFTSFLFHDLIGNIWEFRVKKFEQFPLSYVGNILNLTDEDFSSFSDEDKALAIKYLHRFKSGFIVGCTSSIEQLYVDTIDLKEYSEKNISKFGRFSADFLCSATNCKLLRFVSYCFALQYSCEQKMADDFVNNMDVYDLNAEIVDEIESTLIALNDSYGGVFDYSLDIIKRIKVRIANAI